MHIFGAQRGFTLIELMFTIAIGAILMAIAVPGFRTITQNTQQRNVVSDLNAMLSRMRTESAARHQGVSACASANQATCSGATTWETGWIMFVDGMPGFSPNGTWDAGETIIQVHGALPAGVTLRTLGPPSAVTLSADGVPAARATFVYCDERGMSSLRALIVGGAGIIRVVADGNDHTGAAIAACI